MVKVKQSKRKTNRAQRVRTVPAAKRMVPPGPSTQRVNRVSKRRRMRARLTPSGEAFLKCAFAPPDFSTDPGMGIPDNYHGRVLTIKDCATTPIAFEEDRDTYILVAPVPGYSYFIATVGIGEEPASLTGNIFPTYDTNFSNEFNKTPYSKFRYASLCAGLYPTSNSMQFSGSIQVYRFTASLGTYAANIDSITPTLDKAMFQRIKGLESITPSAPRDNYSTAFINGAFSQSTDVTEFDWSEFNYSEVYTNSNTSETGSFTKSLTGQADRKLPGLGNMQCILIKVSTPKGAINTGILKTWACMEMQPNTNSNLYQFSHVSPPLDPAALVVYRNIANDLPIATTSAENDKTWDKIKRIISSTLTIGSLAIPGVGGMVAAGAGAAFNLGAGIADLFI